MGCCASSVSRSQRNQKDVEAQRCCTSSTTIKATLFVLGFLLIGAAGGLYFTHINAIASYAAASCGLATIIGAAIWSLVGCCSKKSPEVKKDNLKDCTEQTINLPSGERLSLEDVEVLLIMCPNLKKLNINVSPGWSIKDFDELGSQFTWNHPASSDTCLVFERRQFKNQKH